LSGTISRTVVPRFGEEDSSSFPPSSSARSRMAARPKPVGWLVIAAAPPAAMAPPLAVPMAPIAAGSNPVPSSVTSSTIVSRCR